jgi:hypothetical protein
MGHAAHMGGNENAQCRLYGLVQSSSGQSSWLQIQRSGFDSQRYQIFWEVVGLEQGPLSLVEYNRGATWKKK